MKKFIQIIKAFCIFLIIANTLIYGVSTLLQGSVYLYYQNQAIEAGHYHDEYYELTAEEENIASKLMQKGLYYKNLGVKISNYQLPLLKALVVTIVFTITLLVGVSFGNHKRG